MQKFLYFILLCLFSQIVFANFPYHPINFPRDAGAHYKNIPYPYDQLIEWWYFNGYVQTDDGKNLSYMISFFHPALQLAGSIFKKPILHIQVANLDSKMSFGSTMTYPFNSGKIATDKLDISLNDDYLLQEITQNGKTFYVLKATGKNKNTTLKINLVLEPISNPFLINENGLMPMPNNTNSYYYSIPHFRTTGEININNSKYTIEKNPGDSWFDHQWGDFDLTKNGWEWFGIRLQNGLIANIFLNIDYKNQKLVMGLASIILPNGEKYFVTDRDFIVSKSNYWFDPQTEINYPMTFNFKFPKLGLDITNDALFPEQEVNGYWEGYCNVSAIYQKQEAKGFSFMELIYRVPLII